MKKDTYYLRHDCNARQDEKLLALRMKHGWEGYGLFWAIVERLRECSNYECVKDYNLIAFDLRVNAAIVKSVVEDFGLFTFTEDGKRFYSKRLSEDMAIKDDISEKRSVAGKKGLETRWEKLRKTQEKEKGEVEKVEKQEFDKKENSTQSASYSKSIANDSKSIANGLQIIAIRKEDNIEDISKSNDLSISPNYHHSSIIYEANASLSTDVDAPVYFAQKKQSHDDKLFIEIVKMFNEAMKGRQIGKVAKLTKERKGVLQSRVSDYGIEKVQEVIRKSASSNFLNGDGKQGFIASFDWIFRPRNFLKILEGNYDNRTNNNGGADAGGGDKDKPNQQKDYSKRL